MTVSSFCRKKKKQNPVGSRVEIRLTPLSVSKQLYFIDTSCLRRVGMGNYFILIYSTDVFFQNKNYKSQKLHNLGCMPCSEACPLD